MKLILHGVLKELFGSSHEFKVNTVADAIEGFSRQAEGLSRDLVVEAVGFDTEEKLRAVGSPTEVHLLPAMFGGGGKFGKIIMGALTIAVSFIPGIGPALAVSLQISGGLMIASGVVNLFMKAPSISKSNDPPASKYLGVNKNTTAIGTPITSAWGRIKLGGHFLSLQVDSNNLVHGVWPETPA